MGDDKITSFYDDPVKRACDDASLAKAYDLRALSLNSGLLWQARRGFKFLSQFAVGTLRHLGPQAALKPKKHAVAPAATHVGTSPKPI
jgi:hypothetical protein